MNLSLSRLLLIGALCYLPLCMMIICGQAYATASTAPVDESQLPALDLSTPAAQRVLQEFRRCTFNMRLSANRRKLVGHGVSLDVPKGAIIRRNKDDVYIRGKGVFHEIFIREIIVPPNLRRRATADVFALVVSAEPQRVAKVLTDTWDIRFKKNPASGNRKIYLTTQSNTLIGGERLPGLSLGSDSIEHGPTTVGCSHIEL